MVHANILIALALVFSFFMAFGVGANDVANAMGTSVGAKVLTLFQAVIIATIFEVAGAMLASGEVSDTIRSQIVNVHLFGDNPMIFVYGMLASLLSAGTWLAFATYFGWPVSTTHSIIGAIIGFSAIGVGLHAVNWMTVVNIFLSWVVTPVIAGLLAYSLFISVYKLILNAADPLRNAKRYLPFYVFFASVVILLFTLFSELKPLNLPVTKLTIAGISFFISLGFALLSLFFLSRVNTLLSSNRKLLSANLEKAFGLLTVFTACSLAFAHGSNDVANAIGPLAAIINVVNHNGSMHYLGESLVWIPLFGAVGIVMGLATCGYRVIATVGSDITLLTPSRAFAAQLATASTVIAASSFGLPVSTTQTLVGAVLGVGFARGISSVNLGVIGNIFISWVITLPAGALMSILFFYLIQFVAEHF